MKDSDYFNKGSNTVYDKDFSIIIKDSFVNKLTTNTKDIDPEYVKLVNENFWDLIKKED